MLLSPTAKPSHNVLAEFFSATLAVGFVAVALYFGTRLLGLIDALKDSIGLSVLQYVGLVFCAAMFGRLVFLAISAARDARTASEAKRLVDEELAKRQVQGTANVADVSTKEVLEAINLANVSKAHLERLIEQAKQESLIDDELLQAGVNDLVVEYLQPLPRNAKRLVNRFRVSLLIAHKRGMLNGSPRIEARHLGKWLVLGERWPQLSRALSASPHAMVQLERLAAFKTPAPGSSKAPLPKEPGPDDSFTALVSNLAPFYVGDEDLRSFLRSEPQLDNALPLLVHLGDPGVGQLWVTVT